MSNKSLQDYQAEIDDWAQQFKKPYWEPLSQLARLVEETGEVARILNHKYGDKPKKPTEAPDSLEDELGDVLFDLICLANSEGISLSECLERVIEKAQVRDKDRFPKK